MTRGAAIAIGRDGSGRYLTWTIGLKAFFAALAIAALVGLEDMSARWSSGQLAVVTVQLPAGAPEASVEAALEAVWRTVGVAGAKVLPPDEVVALLDPWLGAGNLPEYLPLPVLIDVRPDPGAAVDWTELEARLAADVPSAMLETSGAWVERLLDLTRLAQLFAAMILVVVAAVAAISVVFATRAGLAVHRDSVELLHLLGARDRFIASEFQWPALWFGLRGGIGGLLPAVGVLFALGYAAGRLDAPLLPEAALGVRGWVALAAVPLVTAATAMVAARLTVLGTLARLP
jgi:cell division transport system permease protein